MIYTPESPVSLTVYSLVFKETEDLIRKIASEEQDVLLSRHRNAHFKTQDPMHLDFFNAWKRFSSDSISFSEKDFPETYPSNGSSESIFHVFANAKANDLDLVVFDGDYEGYRSLAESVGVRVHIVNRNHWREVLSDWARGKTPFANRKVQWWVSQPSAIDGNVWEDYSLWIEALEKFEDRCQVWVDLTYVGRATITNPIELTSPVIAGFVFSLSKVMGAYYRRIGGCFSRYPIPSLWGNRWFKNLDSLYLGQRWLEVAGNSQKEGARLKNIQDDLAGVSAQRWAMQKAFEFMGSEESWVAAGVYWKPSDVSLLMYAEVGVGATLALSDEQESFLKPTKRGINGWVSSRLCLTPALATRFAY